MNDQLAQSLQNLFLNAIPETSIVSSVHKQGEIILDEDNRITVDSVLFDTGALHGNYVSLSFVNRNKQSLIPFLHPCNGLVRLADNKTIINISQVLVIPVAFIGDGDIEHLDTVTFCVLPTCNNDMIIGLPAIVDSFSTLLKEMIDTAVARKVAEPNLSVIKDILSDTMREPWSHIDLEAPEDLDTELPCSFPYALHYMEMSPEAALEEYISLIPTHVSQEFRDSTDIVNLLKTKGSKVFVPQNWEGIKGIPPLELKFKEGFPESMKPRARPVNPKLYEHAHKEFKRLLQYFYVPSSSPVASCLVIAPKATAPFIRFCGDYVAINKFIEVPHQLIPHVQRSLEKIMKYKIFVDLDMINSFHQIKLADLTSSRLSVQTPWGQVQPLCLPEGVGPASHVLQTIVAEIFADFLEWMIVIFDNFLILAHDFADAYRKTELVLDRCIERNLFLKFSKTWLGFREAKFFGYNIKEGSYELTQERKDAIMSIPFPSNTKQMQSFLGAALFFKSFIPHYSSLTAPLNDMVKLTFDWNESTWTHDYRATYESIKLKLQEATSIFYPDYSLDWTLRTDASLHGVGAVLLQIAKSPTDNTIDEYQPIAFVSQKFSPQATRWSTIEQEAYGIYFGVKSFSYYLMCKNFVLETDHNNLLWMEASYVPKVIRWRIYLQSYNFLLRHIPGKQNTVADWLSRAHAPPTDNTPAEPSDDRVTNSIDDPEIPSAVEHAHMYLSHLKYCLDCNNLKSEPDTTNLSQFSDKVMDIFNQCHSNRNLHGGTRVTWNLMNKHFPGHNIPYRVVSELVSTCPVCQKDRLGMAPFDTIEPIVRTLRPAHQRALIGADTLTITPPDCHGNTKIITIVVIMSKLVYLYPAKTSDAKTVATAIFSFCSHYGLFDSLITDPGSEFDNEVVKHLNSWFGISHKFSLVDRHESNGVEATNREIQRYLRALVMDERVKDRWSEPHLLGLIQFHLNSKLNSETGVVPFHAHFGTQAGTYFRMPEEGTDLQRVSAYIKLLDEDLKIVKAIMDKVTADIAKERTSLVPYDKQNKFQPQDLVLFQLNPDEHKPNKLDPRFIGPYEVIHHDKNDVTCKHVNLGHVKIFHSSRLKIFHGTYQQAKEVAYIDQDQYVISKIIAYRGEPMQRTNMKFEIEWDNGEITWRTWDRDLFDSQPYETYVRSKPELFPLLYNESIAKKEIATLNKTPITLVQPGDIVYVDIRCYSATWYANLPLPDKDHVTYLVEYVYKKWIGNKKLKLSVYCPVFKETFTVDHRFVKQYGHYKSFNPNNPASNECYVDDNFIQQYPELLPST